MPIKKVMLLFLSLYLLLGTLTPAAGAAAGGVSPSLKLAVEDSVSEIRAVSIHNTYYVPLRSLSDALGWRITGQKNGIQVAGNSRSLLLLSNNGGALLKDGTTVPMNTVLDNGSLLIPLKLSIYLGYSVSYEPDKYLLRVWSGAAKLDNAAFAEKFKAELKPKPSPDAGTAASSGKPGQTVYLTFDDGPSATTTQLLDQLGKHGVRASFFMLGQHMRQYPAQVKRIAADGHGLGLHGMTHVKDKFYASPAAALQEMEDANAILTKLAGKGTTLIRPPYGSKPYFTRSFRDKVLVQGYHLWDWNVDSEDWKYKEDSATIYNSVMAQVHKLKSSKTDPVILMHDQKATLLVLPRILDELKKEGYSFGVITGSMTPVNFWKDKR
ncbi:polysaccharide deacetylase [Paenibacillus tepidiphilus]|uniref:polysaccharide deacetylase n=1 Tax=Paenibacillus tepidiphilus TaxID=2608683 RepID=UPI0012392010|nr:polysaccharide deacetylase [Paenibacillus tepidiphilus]